MNKETEIMFNKVFRITSFVLLIITVLTIPIVFLLRKISYDNYLILGATLGADSEAVKNFVLFEMPMAIYKINSVLCVISIILQIIYFATKKILCDNKKITTKERLIKNWPCLLLAFFMAWTSVGCIQAGMEMDAELYIKRAKNIEDVPQRLIDIANWSPNDRMANTTSIYQNAKDRAWHGCENLKDGYFSFMFYATIVLNILMLGNESKKHKTWVLRVLLISSLFLGICTLISFYRPIVFKNVCYFKRAIFNNSNHFGYYMSVVMAMSAVMWIREKSLYFKGLNLLNFIIYAPLLMINNTFGAFLGVLCAMVFLFITTCIRVFKDKKKVKELIQYLICAIVFFSSSFTIASSVSNNYTRGNNYFSYSILNFNFGDSTYALSCNSISDIEAKALGIDDTTVNGVKVKWGNKIEKLNAKQKSYWSRNFGGLINDIKVLSGFVEETKKVSGDGKITITQEEFNAKLSEISAKYPKVSGETLEEFNERQNKIQEEYSEVLNTYVVGETKVENSKSGLTEEVSSIGSGRGETWIKVLDLVNQRPWFGWGLENLLNEFYGQYGISEGRTHNLVLQLAGTVGIPGVAAYLIATISIFMKNIFDAKFRKYSRNQLLVIFVVMVVAAIATALIIGHFTDKLLFIWAGIIAVEILIFLISFTKKVKLRVSEWNEFEHVGTVVFVSYMISSLFGNSAFYTSPYFMIFLGILVYEMLHKNSLIVDEQNSASNNKAESSKNKIIDKSKTKTNNVTSK